MDPILSTNVVRSDQEQFVKPAPTGEDTGSAISSDFETFLKMLTTQIENQDPLNPIESSDFAVQLATFSGVEQQVQTNDLLKDIVAKNDATGLADLAGWVGMEARSATPRNFDGTSLTLTPPVIPTATTAQLVVRDTIGAEIQRIDIDNSGAEYNWAGILPGGGLVPPGSYSFSVEGYRGGTLIGTENLETYDTVTEVLVTDTGPMLRLEGGGEVAADAVTAVREAANGG
ncbi:MAG: flagellar hook capping FlgD N-terminal domain-containing protein [Pseudomonadota bacterium]